MLKKYEVEHNSELTASKMEFAILECLSVQCILLPQELTSSTTWWTKTTKNGIKPEFQSNLQLPLLCLVNHLWTLLENVIVQDPEVLHVVLHNVGNFGFILANHHPEIP